MQQVQQVKNIAFASALLDGACSVEANRIAVETVNQYLEQFDRDYRPESMDSRAQGGATLVTRMTVEGRLVQRTRQYGFNHGTRVYLN
jgi:hypothetical protein